MILNTITDRILGKFVCFLFFSTYVIIFTSFERKDGRNPLSEKWWSTNSSFYLFSLTTHHLMNTFIKFSFRVDVSFMYEQWKRGPHVFIWYMRALRLCMYFALPLASYIFFLIFHLLFQFVCLTVMETVQLLHWINITKPTGYMTFPFDTLFNRENMTILRFSPKNSTIESLGDI